MDLQTCKFHVDVIFFDACGIVTKWKLSWDSKAISVYDPSSWWMHIIRLAFDFFRICFFFCIYFLPMLYRKAALQDQNLQFWYWKANCAPRCYVFNPLVGGWRKLFSALFPIPLQLGLFFTYELQIKLTTEVRVSVTSASSKANPVYAFKPTLFPRTWPSWFLKGWIRISLHYGRVASTPLGFKGLLVLTWVDFLP